MRFYCGIDLHSTNNYLGIYDEEDRAVVSKRLPNDLGVVLESLEPYKAELAGIAVESTYNWYWLVDGLMDRGYRVLLTNPAGNEQYNGLKYTDDRHDSRWLARMLRLGIVATGYIYPKEERPIRDLLRKRMRLVQHRTAHIVSVLNTIARNTGSSLSWSKIETIMYETGEISRFAQVGDYCSYARCVGSVRISNGKKKGENNTKNGNRYLSWAYVEAANFASRLPAGAQIHSTQAGKGQSHIGGESAGAQASAGELLRDERSSGVRPGEIVRVSEPRELG